MLLSPGERAGFIHLQGQADSAKARLADAQEEVRRAVAAVQGAVTLLAASRGIQSGSAFVTPDASRLVLQ